MKRIHILKEKNGNAYYYKSILPSKFSPTNKDPFFLDGVDGWKDKDLIYMPDKLDFHTLPKYKLVAESLSDLDVLYDDMVKEVKPKWYENKWLWFFGGIFVTTQSIRLAGELTE